MPRHLAGSLLLGALLTLTACSSVTRGTPAALPSATPPTSSSPSSPTSRPPSPTRRPSTRPSTAARRSTAAPRAGATTSAPTRRPSGEALPLGLPTYDAGEVITAIAPSTASTSGTLQAWQRTAAGWRRVGPSVTAHFGSAGLTYHSSESVSATPIGSYRLFEAFGSQPDPGTGLPYLRTGPSDWWISQPGRLYNTHQRCSSNCPFTQGAPNEHLYYEQPYYRYAVVIDVNASDSGHSTPGAGSAYFLHVTDGGPTAGCVAIDEATLVSLMRWLTPAAHPRILIGTG